MAKFAFQVSFRNVKWNNKYKITLEDESSLEKKLNFSAKTPVLWLILIALLILAGAFGVFITASTPMKNYLPGYLKKSERTATEEQHLRLDSLIKVYEVHEAYIGGILNALNPVSEETDKKVMERRPTPLSADSLLPASEVEKNFMEQIREQEKYNIAYLSQAAAQTMMFGPLSKAALISENSRDSYQAEIILPIGSTVSAIAEGKVISVASSPKASGGFEIIIQHPKGFLSKTSRLSNLLVRPGDRVASGQIIATGTIKPGMQSSHVIFELWHDGDQLLPARYINTGI